MSRVSGAPDVTVYREDLDALIGGCRTSQMSLMKTHKRFSHFVLRHSIDRSDFYDKRGAIIRAPSSHPVACASAMSAAPVRCDNVALARQTTWLTESPTVCGSFEAHSGQSAADRGNFYTMLDQMVNLAKSDQDREHIYVLSQHSPCSRSLMIADLTKTTERVQSLFLDYFRRLRDGWPLQESHHKIELSRTLAGCRYGELRRWIKAVRMSRKPNEDETRFDLVMASLPASVRFAMAQVFVESVYPKFRLAPGGVEQLDDGEVLSRADVIGQAVDRLLSTPMSNI